MKRIRIPLFIALVGSLMTFSSCSKESEDTPIDNHRACMLEISGNYTGHISLTYTDTRGVTVIDTITSLPWTKDLPYANRVDMVSISGISDDNAFLGSAGQTGTIKFYSAGEEISSQSATADGSGVLDLQPLKHSFIEEDNK